RWLDWYPLAQRLRDLVPRRMRLGFLGSELTKFDHAGNERVVARHLGERFPALVIDPAIADVTDKRLTVPDHDDGRCRAHPLAGGVAGGGLGNDAVALLKRLAQSAGQDRAALLAGRATQKTAQHG